MGVATIISFCTNDYRFLGKCVQEARLFSRQVIVSVCDHFFDGSPENRDLLNWAYHHHPDCDFIEFPYSQTTVYPTYFRYKPEESEWVHHWHSFGRLMGFYHVRPDIEWVLFLDCDEIPDGRRCLQYFERREFLTLDAARLGCYYYALKPNLRALKVQELSLLVRRKALQPHFFYYGDERYAMYRCVRGAKQADVRGCDGRPLIHHYSWVRPELECYHKSRTWGHRSDRDWNAIIKDTFQGKRSLFGINLQFQEITDVYFDPLSVVLPEGPAPKSDFPHCRRLTFQDYTRLELEWDPATAYHSAL